jgi:hypothetical protein
MPWKDVGGELKFQRISVGKELKNVMDAAMSGDSLQIHFVIAQNWPSWDAALILQREEKGKRDVYVIFLQTTINPDHEIYANICHLMLMF